MESVPANEETVNAIILPVIEASHSEPTSADSISPPPAVILEKSEQMGSTSSLPTADTIPHEAFQESDVQSISETVKSAPAQLEHTDSPILEPVPRAPNLRFASRQLENVSELPTVPEEPVDPILSTDDESDNLSSIAPPSEERFDHRQTLSTWAASSDSEFGVNKLPSLESEFDEDSYPTLGIPDQHKAIAERAAPQMDDSSYTSSVDVEAQLAKLQQRNNVKYGTRPKKSLSILDYGMATVLGMKDMLAEGIYGPPPPRQPPQPVAQRVPPSTTQRQANAPIAQKAAVPATGIVGNGDVSSQVKSTEQVAQSKVDAPEPILNPPVMKEKISNPADGQDDTLTASRDSHGKDNNKLTIPLDRVNAILTPQEKMAMHLPPSDEDIWLDLIPRPVKNIIEQQKANKVESPRIPYPSGTLDTKFDIHNAEFGHQVGSKYPIAIENGKAEGQSVSQSYGVPPLVQPVNVQPGGIPVEVTKPSAHNGQSLSPVVTKIHDISAKLLKPAGFVSAGFAGIGALVGVVWVFDKVKGFFNRKRTKKASGNKRRHVRDWSVE